MPSPKTPTALRGYREIFAVPGSAAFVVAGWFGRMPRSTLSLGSVLLIAGATGRYTLAAGVAAAIVVGTALLGPLWSRAMDHYGQQRVLLAGLAASTLAGVFLVGSVTADLPVWTWFLAAFLVGGSAVDIGSVTRARWSNLLPPGHQRHTAYSIESVADESVYVIGPPVVTVLAAAVSPVLGFGVGLVLGIAGGVALVLQRRTEPPVREEAAQNAAAPTEATRIPPAPQQPGHPDAAAVAGGARPAGRRARPPLWRRLPEGVAGTLPLFLGVGLVFGSIDLTAVGVANAAGEPAAAGFLLAMYALGSVAAGLVFGLLRFTVPPVVRVGSAAVLYALVLPVVAFVPDVTVLGIVLLLSGLVTTPLLISGMGLVESRVDPARLTEALTWPSTAMSVGVTAGSSVAGILMDGLSARSGFVVTVVGAFVVGVCGLVMLAAHRARSQRVTSLDQAD
ncbi:MFS transporter [Herbiconiux sp. 11R-BC]|uniref:MFS transporter n=1 Tax=Herbiconiux sp. 11R-BC TaxID=3111637 RepID=UPI003C0CE03A